MILRVIVDLLGDQGNWRSIVRGPESTCERRDRGRWTGVRAGRARLSRHGVFHFSTFRAIEDWGYV